jgi:hypothetical protein
VTAAVRPGLSKQETAERAYRELHRTIAAKRLEIEQLEEAIQPVIETLVVGYGVRLIEVDGAAMTFRKHPTYPTQWVRAPRLVAVEKKP